MTINELLTKKIGFISLGCDKNRVDLEKIIANIKSSGFDITPKPEEAQIIIINTCSFIESARIESINTILEMDNLKNLNLEKIVVTGCLNQMGYADLQASLPEVDGFIKVENNDKIIENIFALYNVDMPKNNTYDCKSFDRVVSTPRHYAYLKISEGCNNFCSYCTIPFIRGRFKSTPIEELIEEAKMLVNNGAKEIILVGQDVTKYGLDLYKKHELVALIKELSKIKELIWIRLLYCYPELVSDELISEIKNNPKVVKYIDLPMQHCNSNILKKMNRKTDKTCLEKVLNKLKTEIPNISIRSTFIIGFPGETSKNFKELIMFLKQYKLNNVGFFAYSKEAGTMAFNMKHQVPKFIKNARVKRAYNCQEKISHINNLSLLNSTIPVIIDYKDSDCFIGRSMYNAPDVDNKVIVYGNATIGQIENVLIKDVSSFDIKGEIL